MSEVTSVGMCECVCEHYCSCTVREETMIVVASVEIIII